MDAVVLSTKAVKTEEVNGMDRLEGAAVKVSKNKSVWTSVSGKKQTDKSTHKKVHASTKSRQPPPALALDMFWTRCIMDKIHGIGWRKDETEPISKLLTREVLLAAFMLFFIASLGQEIRQDQLLLERFGNPDILPERFDRLDHMCKLLLEAISVSALNPRHCIARL